MLNRSASLAMSTSVLKGLPGKLDIKRNSPSILYFYSHFMVVWEQKMVETTGQLKLKTKTFLADERKC